MPNDSNSDIDRDQLIATRAIEQIDVAQKFSEQELATHARWLTASLFAINSAGIIAVASGKFGASGILPGLIFVLGIGASLLSGYALQLIYGGYTAYLHAAGRYWFGVKIGDHRDDALEEELRVSLARANRWKWTAPAFGWASGLLFIGGAVVTGVVIGGVN